MTEPIELMSSDQIEIPSEMQLGNVKLESDCLVPSETNIKTEPQEDESNLPVIAGTSYDVCPNYDMKFERDEPMIKIEYKDVTDNIMQDPLDVVRGSKGSFYKMRSNDGIKVEVDEPMIKIEFEDLKNAAIQDPLDVTSKMSDEEHVQGVSRVKTEPAEEIKDDNCSKTDKDDSQSSSLNQGQDQLLIRNDPDCKDKKYVCNECNRAFRLKGDLNRHLRIHTGEKPHICDVCQKDFSRKSILDKHKLIHSGVKPFSCSHCVISFTQKSHLVAHERMHTGDKPYICDMCHKAFVKKSDLTSHMRTHTGEKPYSCEVCYKSFAFKPNLDRHKKIHKK